MENKPPKDPSQVEARDTTTVKIELPPIGKAIMSLKEKGKNIKLPNSTKEIKEKAQDQVRKFFKKGRNVIQGIKEKLEKGTKE